MGYNHSPHPIQYSPSSIRQWLDSGLRQIQQVFSQVEMSDELERKLKNGFADIEAACAGLFELSKQTYATKQFLYQLFDERSK